MRLINTSTLQLKDFLGDKVPPYAILSHVWSNDEISHEDYLTGRKQDGHGYQKILKLCHFARNGLYDLERALDGSRNLEWAWMDTCCIDKRSSAELSEAINSMYEWYSRASVCLVFLSDVHEVSELDISGVCQLEKHYNPWVDKELSQSKVSGQAVEAFVRSEHWTASVANMTYCQAGNHTPFALEALAASRWFTRGWTLQELLAPRQITFLNSNFHTIGHCHKSKSIGQQFLPRPETETISLHILVARIAGISFQVIYEGLHHQTISPCIAQKMSWAARRVTTRGEDMAYCLLGLFDVNMPLLYGEGELRAFGRLQLEIMSRSVDQSIFMWKPHISEYHLAANLLQRMHGFSLLAKSPAAFQSCSDAVSEPHHDIAPGRQLRRSVFTKTARGLELEVRLPPGLRLRSSPGSWLLYPLECRSDADGQSCYLAFCIGSRRQTTYYADGAQRACCATLIRQDGKHELQVLQHILQQSELNIGHLRCLSTSGESPHDRKISAKGIRIQIAQFLRGVSKYFQKHQTIRLYFPEDAEMYAYVPNG